MIPNDSICRYRNQRKDDDGEGMVEVKVGK